MRILIVDDEPGIRVICERTLRRAGHEVQSCETGERAVERLGEPWDLIVSDVNMPGSVDGNELLRRARAAGGVPVALMTSYPSIGSTVSAIHDGACDYLLKPFSLDALLELVRRRETGLRERPPHEPRSLRAATILFADVRGFTAYAESVPAETAAAELDKVLARFAAAVLAEGGTIHKFTGDGAMALFGLPLPHAEPVAAAARAALRSRESVAALGRLNLGYGLNSGLVAAGSIGSPGSERYDVIGSPVNLAGRLVAAAEAGSVLVGPGARAQLDSRFLCSAPRGMLFQGFREPTAVSELLQETD